ncbi:GABAtrnsam: 4-aminobutyrate transaminase [Gaiella occulta]|uniref:(S)-3-amino-2-methylpropionate transaminase n=1 Tax=Gaiella occulta TaxID=1002870 RepID=A0A7M2Z019_9ACTN|nr:4-aminobutyrate--2-oxoglutarate transaminase [Gaiella occulta]RDI75610.1 GABAtrnsam: 4-aminobutyrate transaminase [Gaiella occulta]
MAATRTIELRTEIPGPRSREIFARAAVALAKPLQVYLPVFAAKAHGATITDVDGNTFIDFAGGVGVVNVGHCNPHVVDAIQEQAARFVHTDFTVVPYESYVDLAERLGALAPIGGPTRAAFFNSGAEAVENAVKIARLSSGRPAVIAFEAGFHGRTLLAMTMTSKVHPYKTGMGPFAPEVYRAPFPHAYRGISSEDALAAIERMFHTHVAPSQVAAIVFEPQLGEGGFIPAPPAFVEGIRAICDRHGIVMVADEVQTGFGRTGRMFAMEHYGVEPDLVVVAKSIAAGLPLSGVIGRAEIMDAPHAGAVGGTYIGNPVALAAALAVLDVFAEDDLVARAAVVGERIRERMLAWQRRRPQIGDVRGLGAMLAVELVRDPATKEPAADLAARVIEAALERGLILLKAGVEGNCIRVLCPLTIEDAVLDEALAVWDDALAAVLA